jgi:hypothetical protein
MRKVQRLVAGEASSDLAALAAVLEAEAARSHRIVLPRGGRVRWGVKVPEDPFTATEQGRQAGAFGIDGFVEVAGPDSVDWADLVDALAGASDRLGSEVDPGRSAAVVGVEHDIVPGDLPVLLVYALRRLPSPTHEGFSDYWLGHHAEFGRRLQDGRGYRQFHADHELSVMAAESAGLSVSDLDGVAEASFPDVETFLDLMARPEVAADAMEDEKRFIDHSRSAGVLTRVRHLGRG